MPGTSPVRFSRPKRRRRISLPANSSAPHAKRPVISTQPSKAFLNRLTLEINTFVKKHSIAQPEKLERDLLIKQIEKGAKGLWPESSVELFGSYATGLGAYGSDVDLTINDVPDGSPKTNVKRLARVLEKARADGKPVFTKIQRITKARIPIIKGASAAAGIKFDVSFTTQPVAPVVRWVRGRCAEFPLLRPLVFLVKALLADEGLDEPYTGGMGGYMCVLLCVAYLRKFPHPPRAAGAAFLGLLDFYGARFRSFTKTVCLREAAVFIPRKHPRAAALERYQPGAQLSIEDPLSAPPTDIGGGCFRFRIIAKVFKRTRATLLSAGRRGATEPMLAAVIGPNLRGEEIRQYCARAHARAPLKGRRAAPRRASPSSSSQSSPSSPSTFSVSDGPPPVTRTTPPLIEISLSSGSTPSVSSIDFL